MEEQMNETERKARIAYLDGQMAMRHLWAQIWIAEATTGAATRRSIFRGDRKLTAEELTDDALKTARGHLHLYSELLDSRDKLIRADPSCPAIVD